MYFCFGFLRFDHIRFVQEGQIVYEGFHALLLEFLTFFYKKNAQN